MSQELISLNPDLQKLQNEGFAIEVRDGYLLVRNVPYVNGRREVNKGILAMALDLVGNKTTRPSTHVAFWCGEHPCYSNGSSITNLVSGPARIGITVGLTSDFQFSQKPSNGYADYHEKVVTYVGILESQAHVLDKNVTARNFDVIKSDQDDSVFNYVDTASSRANITNETKKLELGPVAIVGLGGTGSYILDLIAKTTVKEIHLFDQDDFLQHNAFRSPGAPSIDDLTRKEKKVNWFSNIYSNMHKGIKSHVTCIGKDNVTELQNMSFVFLSLDTGLSKRYIVEYLLEHMIPFIDVGMGLYSVSNSIGGTTRVTLSTPEKNGHIYARIGLNDALPTEYDQNIQIADLNALNAALAVIRWKRMIGFYVSLDNEYSSTYTVGTNTLVNDEVSDETKNNNA